MTTMIMPDESTQPAAAAREALARSLRDVARTERVVRSTDAGLAKLRAVTGDHDNVVTALRAIIRGERQ